MRIVSLNIWNIQGPSSRTTTALPNALRDLDADLLLLQEVSLEKPGWPQSRSIMAAVGHRFERYFHAGVWKGRDEGLAITSRHPIVACYCAPLPTGCDGMGRIVCGAQIDFCGQAIDAFNMHLAYPLAAELDRLAQAVAAKELVEAVNRELSARPLVIAGDFNDVPDSAALGCFLKSPPLLADSMHGLSDTDRVTFSDRNPYADNTLGTNRCIDYVLHNDRLRVTNRRLIGTGGHADPFVSDHFGLCIDLEVSNVE